MAQLETVYQSKLQPTRSLDHFYRKTLTAEGLEHYNRGQVLGRYLQRLPGNKEIHRSPTAEHIASRTGKLDKKNTFKISCCATIVDVEDPTGSV